MADEARRHEVTQLLQEWSTGDQGAVDELLPIVYDDLRRIAHSRLRLEREQHTLNTTALVHEAYLKLVDQNGVQWQDRAHFFAVASMAMRRILVDYARRRAAKKRGAQAERVSLQDAALGARDHTLALIAIDEALSALGEKDERLSRVFECRFFGGMTAEETATALGMSLRTAERQWSRAKAHLYQALSPEGA